METITDNSAVTIVVDKYKGLNMLFNRAGTHIRLRMFFSGNTGIAYPIISYAENERGKSTSVYMGKSELYSILARNAMDFSPEVSTKEAYEKIIKLAIIKIGI